MYDIKTLVQLHDNYCAHACDIMIAKNHDYGGSWESDRATSITDTIRHKIDRIVRLEELEQKGEQSLVSEGISAECFDIINYCIFRLIKEDEKNAISS
jgi:hypothetical protein